MVDVVAQLRTMFPDPQKKIIVSATFPTSIRRPSGIQEIIAAREHLRGAV